jgi:hypothetical protein
MSLKEQFLVAVVNEINLAKTAVTFEAGASQSSVFNCGATPPAEMFFPANWTSCNVSFHVCKTPDGVFVPRTNFDGTALAVATAASTATPTQPSMFHSTLFMKLVCSTPQVNACIVDLGLTPIYQGIHN